MRAWCARLGRLAPAIAKRRSLLSGQEGQALIEYALIISLIALVAIWRCGQSATTSAASSTQSPAKSNPAPR